MEYATDEVIVHCGGRQLARISSGAVEAAPDPLVRPHWQVNFPVDDLGSAIAAAHERGGSLVEELARPEGREATLVDPDGGLFTLTDVHKAADTGAI